MLKLAIAIDEESFLHVPQYLIDLNIDEDMLANVITESYNWVNNFYMEHLSTNNVSY